MALATKTLSCWSEDFSSVSTCGVGDLEGGASLALGRGLRERLALDRRLPLRALEGEGDLERELDEPEALEVYEPDPDPSEEGVLDFDLSGSKSVLS